MPFIHSFTSIQREISFFFLSFIHGNIVSSFIPSIHPFTLPAKPDPTHRRINFIEKNAIQLGKLPIPRPSIAGKQTRIRKHQRSEPDPINQDISNAMDSLRRGPSRISVMRVWSGRVWSIVVVLLLDLMEAKYEALDQSSLLLLLYVRSR